jgi:APA family basic amino acid/polyamine antiporter
MSGNTEDLIARSTGSHVAPDAQMIDPASETDVAQKRKLLRILGLGFGLAVVVGGVIGVSIFRLPGPVAALVGKTWLILLVWALGGMFTLLNANYTAELATMIPKAGGPYVYARSAFGEFAGFVVGWSDWLGNVAALSFLSIAFAEYAIALCRLSFAGVATIAVGVLLLLAVLNAVGVRAGSGAQQLTSFLKAVALLAFVAACFLLGGRYSATNVGQTTVVSPSSPFALFAALVLSFQLVLGAYGGWNSVIYFAEEDENPGRNIPRSLHAGVVLIIIVYLLVNLALIYVLPVSQMATSKLAAADAMQVVFGARGGHIVTALALLSIIGILNAVLMFTPRTLYALGRDGLFSTKAVIVNEGGTPIVALAVTTLTALILIVMGTFEKLMALYAFFAVANYIVLIGALFVLRKRSPDLPRPFRTWAYPVAPLGVLSISVALFIGFIVSDTRNSVYALLILAASYPLYRLLKAK